MPKKELSSLRKNYLAGNGVWNSNRGPRSKEF